MLRLMARAAATFHQRLKRGPATMRSFESRPAISLPCWRILLQRPRTRVTLLATSRDRSPGFSKQREERMRRGSGVPAALLWWAAGVALAGAEEPKAALPFKLGTFAHQGRTFVGLVRAGQAVIDIAAGSAALEKGHPAWPKVKPPADMKDLIARYETG